MKRTYKSTDGCTRYYYSWHRLRYFLAVVIITLMGYITTPYLKDQAMWK